ncbi:hypothetical protein PFISCL1PPCAC_20330, partial [Pristionchus fissidentatus]
IYVPPLIILYLIEIFVILKPQSQFKGAFYCLFLAGAFVDILMVSSTFPEFRIAKFPIVSAAYEGFEAEIGTQIRITLSYICPFIQDMIFAAIAFNRFTSVMRPRQH